MKSGIRLLPCASERSSDLFGGAGFSLPIRAQLGLLSSVFTALPLRSLRLCVEPTASLAKLPSALPDHILIDFQHLARRPVPTETLRLLAPLKDHPRAQLL